MRITEFEIRMIDFIKRHFGVILLVIITIFALILRYKMRDFQSNDFINCLFDVRQKVVLDKEIK